ncbi:hypothetical protein DSCW_24580 [Desulfosarcina widdelii]|uniref:Sigma-54 factor interaction domain-containing protein n=1 Tax=Desulfosarcina widdelii TaxID=947919 RepID=A0A5K7Z5W4_9BACT|nr:hypothetical protein DSCW_24580 [Desulfosarcina widdelii]
MRLLRVLQEQEINRVGGSHPVAVNPRIVAATHRNLEALVKEGRFRRDLYFRIRVFPSASRRCASAGRTLSRFCAIS